LSRQEGTVVRFDNSSSSEVAEMVCFYLTDSEEHGAIEMLGGDLEAQLGQEGIPSGD
jgi:hypothetical protein